MKEKTAKQRYEDGKSDRNIYLRRAQAASNVTDPTLIPQAARAESIEPGQRSDIPEIYQGTGGENLALLASKLVQVLFPINENNVRFSVDESELTRFIEEQTADKEQQKILRQQIETALVKFETAMSKEVENYQVREVLPEALMHYLVSGNVVLRLLPEKLTFYPLYKVVWFKDLSHNIRELIIREVMWPDLLPEGTKSGLPENLYTGSDGKTHEVEVFTHVKWYPQEQTLGAQVQWHQELANGTRIEGSAGSSPMQGCPWVAAPFRALVGENFARGFYEGGLLGDLLSLEEITRALVEGTTQGLKRLFGVDPMGGLTPADVQEAPSGAVLPCKKDQVFEIGDPGRWSAAVGNMFPVIQNTQLQVQRQHSNVAAIQRDSERTTATEIREMAQALDENKGGMYSHAVQVIAMPIMQAIMLNMERDNQLPSDLSTFTTLQMVGGLDAIGRAREFNNLTAWTQFGITTYGPEAFSAYTNPTDVLTTAANSVSVDANMHIKSREQLEAEQAAQREQAIAQGIVDRQLPQANNAPR